MRRHDFRSDTRQSRQLSTADAIAKADAQPLLTEAERERLSSIAG